MKKEGFTLIELLAVIVILAIIALIATPIILNIIKDSKEEARERSIDNIIHTAEIHYAKEGLEHGKAIHIKDIKNMIDGEKPENGMIYFNEKGEVAFSLKFEDQIYVKSFDGEVEKENKVYHLKQAETPKNITGTEQMINTNTKKLFLENPHNITKDQIEKIVTVPTNKVPEKLKNQSWDVSDQGNGKVMAWYTDEDNNGSYEIYIGQNGGVKANPNSSFLFIFLTNLKEIDLTYLDTSDVTNMLCMFADTYGLQTIDVSNFNTTKVTDMSKLFGVNTGKTMSLKDIKGLEYFDTSQVESMRSMFQNCVNLVEINVSSFDTSRVTNLELTFAYAPFEKETSKEQMKLERIMGIENFDITKVTNMRGMFQYCSSLTKLDLRNWDTKNVTSMKGMFNGCSGLTILNLSNFDTRKIGTGPSDNPGSMETVFQNCTNLSTIYVTKEKWVRNIEFDITNMFNNTPAIVKDITTNEQIVW